MSKQSSTNVGGHVAKRKSKRKGGLTRAKQFDAGTMLEEWEKKAFGCVEILVKKVRVA